ncbi:integrin beta-PS-like [Periplaneta americana]|uniref:integrin beta-PS-like n=1 Tax=Periplaneta americana TaxID=6978 RepID=UPI0037E7FDD1
MSAIKIHCVVIVLLLSSSSFAEYDPCVLKQTCGACIQEPKCAWCSDPSWNATNSRCSTAGKQSCAADYAVNPVTEYTDHVSEPLVSYKNDTSKVVQVSPQDIHLKMRSNDPYNVSLRFARAEYPVDLYYLMDLSYSMRDDKETLENLGKSLAESMKNFTSDVRLGFGSFIDKVVLPFTNTLPIRLKEPCRGCKQTPYGFHNHMKLTYNVTNFSYEVSHANISGNIDGPEGGFDALMQVVVCSEEIGWRSDARRLVVFSTDNDFHMAGDGKLGGIVEPNDGQCHLDESGMYTHSKLQDYPSVSHLNHKVKEKAINVIFAVTEQYLPAYRYLTKSIEGAQLGHLTTDSSNILQLVAEQYKKISSAVKMKDDGTDFVKVRYYTSCKDKSAEPKETANCDNLKIGEEVEFLVEVSVVSCPADPNEWNQTIKIFPVGSHESLTIHLELICDCACEHKEHPSYKTNASECSHNGTYACGICQCDERHFGQKCECSATQLDSLESYASNCKPNNDSDIPDCFGQGICFCGECKCNLREDEDERIYGKYCQCDNFSCARVGGQLCAGRGVCDCGQCVCRPGWSGADCNCKTSTDSCVAPGDSAICSDNGYCDCGVCRCEEEFEGTFCERPVTGSLTRMECERLLPCVLCRVHKREPLSPLECAVNCTSLIIQKVDSLEEGENCVMYTEDNCRCEFFYSYNDTSVIVQALKTLDCPVKLGYYPLIAIVGLVFLVGLFALALWKLYVVRKDRIEFAKFEDEQKKARWEADTNPLYRQPVSQFQNPMYSDSL